MHGAQMYTEHFDDEHAFAQISRPLQRYINFDRFNAYWPTPRGRVLGPGGFDARYLPENCAVFELPCYWIHRRHFYVYGSFGNRHPWMAAAPSEHLPFAVHPCELNHYAAFLASVSARLTARDGLRFWALPSSSTRTLLFWPDGEPQQVAFAKTTLTGRAFGERLIHRHNAAANVALSNLVLSVDPPLPTGFDCFPEYASLVPRALPDSGVIFRALPAVMHDECFVVAPRFALIGGDERSPPLYLQMMARFGEQAAERLEYLLCDRFAALWLELFVRRKLILEDHSQNLLGAFTDDLFPIEHTLYRDFEGLTVDWDARLSQGLPIDPLPHAWEWFRAYQTWGHCGSQLIAWRIRNSLRCYHRFLSALEDQISAWYDIGKLGGRRPAANALTARFERALLDGARERLGRLPINDQPHSLIGLVRVLWRLRHELLRDAERHP